MTNITRITLEDVEIHMAVGHSTAERMPGTKTRLKVSVVLFADRTQWAVDDLAGIMDYDRVHHHIMAWQDADHVVFLETLANRLIDFCFEDLRVSRCRACIVKPDIYPNGVPSVEIERSR